MRTAIVFLAIVASTFGHILFHSFITPISSKLSNPSVAMSQESVSNTDNRIPVTIISGFLGAGKTTFLENILSQNGEKRYGLVVNDMASINIDSKLIKSKASLSSQNIDMIELQNGCICCNLSNDLLVTVAQLASLAEVKGFTYDHIVVECSGISEPRKIRQLFQEAESSESPFVYLVKLDTLITVIDSKLFYDLFGSNVHISEKPELGSNPIIEDDLPPLFESPKGKKVTELLIEQIECADKVIMNKLDLLKTGQDVESLNSVLQELNPSAEFLQAIHGKLSNKIENIVGCMKGLGIARHWGAFDDQKSHISALESECPLCQEGMSNTSSVFDNNDSNKTNSSIHGHHHHHHHHCVHSHGSSHQSSTTSAEERFGITSVVYRRRRPFHPGRFSSFLKKLGNLSFHNLTDIVDTNHGNLSDTQKEIASTALALLRSKGFFWMGSSAQCCYYLSHAGQYLDVSLVGQWWSSIPTSRWPEGEKRKEIEQEMSGDEGDRRQELIFIGCFDDQNSSESLVAVLDDCLLTDEEFSAYKKLSLEGDAFLRQYFFGIN